MSPLLLLAIGLQVSTWTARPTAPTVGDTVVLERLVPTEVGALGRTRMLDASEQLEPLSAPEIRPTEGGLLVRHTVALFAPGTHTVAMPAIEVLHADGTVEVIVGDTAQVVIVSVIPDTLAAPSPMPSRAPLARPVRDPGRAVLPVIAVVLLLGAWLAWRRRLPSAARPPAAAPPPTELPLMRWLATGERRAVAAIAVHRLREVVAATVPESATAAGPEAWAAAVAAAQPAWPVAELTDVMRALERARFAPLVGEDLVELVDRAEVVLGRLHQPVEDATP